jgi:hypothetical protein
MINGRPTTDDVKPLVYLLYDLPQHGCGGCLHITLEDGNLEDSSVQFCADYAQERGCFLCGVVATAMLQMTMTQRRELKHYAHTWGHE